MNKFCEGWIKSVEYYGNMSEVFKAFVIIAMLFVLAYYMNIGIWIVAVYIIWCMFGELLYNLR